MSTNYQKTKQNIFSMIQSVFNMIEQPSITNLTNYDGTFGIARVQGILKHILLKIYQMDCFIVLMVKIVTPTDSYRIIIIYFCNFKHFVILMKRSFRNV